MTVYSPGLDVDFLADGILFAEELVPGIVPQDHHVFASLIFCVIPQSALKEGKVGDQSDLRCGSLQNGAGDLLAVVFHADIADAELRLHMLKAAIGRDDVWQRAKRDYVIEVELFAGKHFGSGTHADDGHMKYPEDIVAERTDPLLHAIVQPADDRGDGDDSRDTDDDAQDGQTRSQLVGANSLKRHLDGFAGLLSSHECSSWLPAPSY